MTAITSAGIVLADVPQTRLACRIASTLARQIRAWVGDLLAKPLELPEDSILAAMVPVR